MSAYRKNARRAPSPRRARHRALGIAVACAVVAGSALLFTYRRMPWKTTAALRTTREDLGPHSPLASIVCNEAGTEAFAVGGGGQVFERTSELKLDAPPKWTRLETGTTEDLVAFALGDGPTFEAPRLGAVESARVMAVGAHGALVVCSAGPASGCFSEKAGADATLRAIAIDGWQAIAVGDHGTIVHLRANIGSLRRDDAPPILPERAEVPGLTADLRAVTLRCTDSPAELACDAEIADDHHVVARGRGVGRCDDGSSASGVHFACDWSWSVATPTERAPTTIRVPLHLSRTKLWMRREEQRSADLSFAPELRAPADGDEWPLADAPRFVAGASPAVEHGRVALLVADGEVYLAY